MKAYCDSVLVILYCDSVTILLDHLLISLQICIPIVNVCNSVNDCGDYSDEAPSACPRCPSGQFQCPVVRQCINDSLVCNGQNDCSFGADEMNCEYLSVSAAYQCVCVCVWCTCIELWHGPIDVPALWISESLVTSASGIFSCAYICKCRCLLSRPDPSDVHRYITVNLRVAGELFCCHANCVIWS